MAWHAYTRRKKAFWVGIGFGLIGLLVILISLNTGTSRLSPMEVVHTLFGYGSARETTLLFEYRMPRILVTALAGIGLGVAGAILQGVSRNALADPGILGLHAGAAFGLIIYVTLFHSLAGKFTLMIPLFTFAGGVVAAALIVLLSYDRYRGLLPVRLLLVGIALAAGFSAVSLFLSLQLDDNMYSFAARWLAGNVWGREWVNVWALLPWIVLFGLYAIANTKVLNAFSLGDEIAIAIGTQVRRKRLLLLAAAVALSSASVSMVGGIGFIGLVAPHLARRLVGPKYQHILPIAGLVGLVILVSADTIGRSLFVPNSIPAGVVVASVGAPYFLYLLVRTKMNGQ